MDKNDTHNSLGGINSSSHLNHINPLSKNNSNETAHCIISSALLPSDLKPRRLSHEVEIRTENNNSMIVEVGDHEYMDYDPLEDVNRLDSGVLNFDLNIEKVKNSENSYSDMKADL
jgi:hypothetical protein